jgi:D-glycero-D-manno-heptose 1,7-bisphosphate phosphatase
VHARHSGGGGRRGDPAVAVKSAVFLDRDGTIIEDVGYIGRREQVAFYPWSVDAVRSLNAAGLVVVVITNQSGVARGYFTELEVQRVHEYVTSVIEEGGARIDAYYYCPHHPDGTVSRYALRCDCRKPGPGLVQRASRDLGLDPAHSFVVGDKWLDIGLAQAVGARGVLVRTGYGAQEEARPQTNLKPDVVVDNVVAAASWILRQLDDR